MFNLYRDPANLCTAAGLFAGVTSIAMLINGHVAAALAMLLLGALADVFDGPLARMSRNRPDGASAFGQELDTLADMCHSVIAPALWIWMAIGQGWIAGVCGLGLSLAGATRLAFFTAIKPDKPSVFIGVPVTYVPLTLGFLAVVAQWFSLPKGVWIAFSVVMIAVQTGRFYFPKFAGAKFWLFAAGMASLTAYWGAQAVLEVVE